MNADRLTSSSGGNREAGKDKGPEKGCFLTHNGFAGRTTYALVAFNLPVVQGERQKSIKINVLLILVNFPSTYNAIPSLTTINPSIPWPPLST